MVFRSSYLTDDVYRAYYYNPIFVLPRMYKILLKKSNIFEVATIIKEKGRSKERPLGLIENG